MAALRDGFTTGTGATAAAIAATLLLRGRQPDTPVLTPLPPIVDDSPAGWWPVPLERFGLLPDGSAFAEVRKDAGDDPDVTDGMIIRVDVSHGLGRGIEIDGGTGIGRVTLPGLQLAPGEAAINPVPRQQIAWAVKQYADRPLKVMLSAPEGEARARGTMNASLGIVGGISILGTHGIVRPFSHDAWRASIIQGIRVASACGASRLCVSTGRRSSDLLAGLYPHLEPYSFLIMGDYIRECLELCQEFEHLSFGCFAGKLVKLAQGCDNTHAHKAPLDMQFMARIAGVPAVGKCLTANAALELLLACGRGLKNIAELAQRHLCEFAGRPVALHVFHMDGRELLRI